MGSLLWEASFFSACISFRTHLLIETQRHHGTISMARKRLKELFLLLLALTAVTPYLISYPTKSSTISWRRSSFDPNILKSSSSKLYLSKGLTYHKAQFKEDIYLYENYFYGVTNGIIVESGALDGILYSTSYMFEKLFQWQAVHIEGSSRHYQSLLQNRNQSVNIYAILCNETKLLHYLHRITPSSVDGILEFMEERFVQKFHKMYWLQKNTMARKNYLDEIQCHPFSDLVRNLSLPRVDLWVLDVEGAELNILQGTFPLPIPIDVIMVEIARRDIISKDKDQVIELLEKEGYICQPHQMNEICHRKDFTPSTLANYRQNSLPEKSQQRRNLRSV
jgi:FkbM family methyltransferase